MSLFIVGDPKQSIYRFRRAEPRVFDAAREQIVTGMQGHWLACDHTRRNAEAVVSAVNGVFGAAAGKGDWQAFRPHTTASTIAGEVLKLVPEEAGAPATPALASAGEAGPRDLLREPRHRRTVGRGQAEAQRVARSIGERVAAGLDPGQIMVLARRRVSLAQVATALGELGLPFTVPEAMSLAHAAPAQDLLAVLDVLVSPSQDLALARALRSPVFGADDPDLIWLARAARAAGDDTRRSWWTTLMDEAALPQGSLGRARELLRGWAKLARELPPHDLLEHIIHSGDVRGRTLAALPPRQHGAAMQAIDALLAAALDESQGRFLSPYRFVRALRRRDPGGHWAVPPNAIRLLTVHGAKGLEAPWVWLVDMDPAPRRHDTHTLLVQWPVEAEAPTRLAFVAREADPAPSLLSVWEEEQRERTREELNGLYVAMTRARDALVFSSTPPATAAASPSWWARVVAHSTAWEPADGGPDAAPQEQDQGPVRVPSLPSWLGARKAVDAPRLPGDAVDAQRAALGAAVHRMLEWIGRPGSDWPKSRWPELARAAAHWAGASPGATLELASRMLDSDDCAVFFRGPALGWAGNELPLGDAAGLMRIDRLVRLDAGERRGWWVLDFKLGSAPGQREQARSQMRRYVRAVRVAQPGERVRAAFLTAEGRCIELGVDDQEL